MSKFTERLRTTPTIRLESLAARIALDEAADIIDELESALRRVSSDYYERVMITEDRVDVAQREMVDMVNDAINKLGR